MGSYSVKLKIADVIIKMRSKFPLEKMTEEEKKLQVSERFDNFSYKGKVKEDILIDIKIVNKLPQISGTKHIFVTYHFQDKSENWRLQKKGNKYIYRCPLVDKKQLMIVNKTFDKVTAYVLPKKNKGAVWNSTDLIYDFLQVLLINYFALHKKGIFTHSIGIKDRDNRGFLFNGKSGAGKSTTARIWYKNSKAMILNDDRIIVRKDKDKFFIHGSPWHGEFSDYLNSRIESALLKRLFFIHHAPENKVKRIGEKEAFNLLYPGLFPTFWDKECLENIVSFSQELIKTVPCFRLGFVNNDKVIDFVRKV